MSFDTGHGEGAIRYLPLHPSLFKKRQVEKGTASKYREDKGSFAKKFWPKFKKGSKK